MIYSTIKKFILGCTIATIAIASEGYAIPMEGDNITLSTSGVYREGSGGEFLLQGSNSVYSDYAVITFCLEKFEYFTPGATYKVDSVSDYAANGGGGAIDGKDDLSDATKWLINAYTNNKDSLFSGTDLLFSTENENLTENNFAGIVQKAIWYFEGEITTSISGDVLDLYNHVNNAVSTEINTLGLLGGRTDYSVLDYTAGYLNNVMVANIVDSDGNPKQSQVFATAPVPEPATMLLFGTGLVGLAGIRRRRKK